MRASVRQGSQDPLKYRLLVDFAEAGSITSAELKIYKNGGDLVETIVDANLTKSGGLVTYQPSSAHWESGTYPIDRNYRAVWTLVSGGVTYVRDERFDVTIRDFVSEVSDSDCFAIQPGVEAQSGSAGLLKYRRQAWLEIEQEIQSALLNNPAVAISPSHFRLAHIYRTLELFYRSQRFGTLGGESEAAIKAQEYNDDYIRTFQRAMQNLTVDPDQDNLINDLDEDSPLGQVRFLK